MIAPREELVERVARAERAVLANGAFDLLHVGHARYLRDARRAGDLLVVAINDDASVRAAKGSARPIVPLEERAELVDALSCVDLVTWFPERTVAATLRLLRPAIHAKGTDYRPGTLPADEQEAHRELGIEVAIVGDPKSHATKSLIETILSS